MDESRTIRITLTGSVFIFSIAFHYWIFGNEIGSFIQLIKNQEKTVELIIALIISSPLFGFIISTFSIFILHLFFGYNIHFLLPKDNCERQIFYNNLYFNLKSGHVQHKLIKNIKTLESLQVISHTPKKRISRLWNKIKNLCIKIRHRRKAIKELHNIFILTVKLNSKDDITSYVVRRWNTFWTHINNIAALFFGAIFGLILSFSGNRSEEVILYFSPQRFLLELFIIIYIIFAIWHLLSSRKEAIKFENIWLSEL